MSDEREWVPVEVIWDGGRDAEDNRDELGWLFADREESADFWRDVPQAPQENPYLTRRKRKKLRGESQ